MALKVLAPPTRGDTTTRERVLHEARAAARVNDPAVASIYEVGDADGVAFIAMEFVEGETLGALLDRGPLPHDRVVRFGHELARGLAKAHAHGVVHRDLKPENIVFDSEGRVKILDFGIAAERGTESRHAGTPVYMAPERFGSGPVSGQADVYSAGVMLFQMLAGRLPFDADGDPLSVAVKHAHEAPPALRALRAEVPGEVAQAVADALGKRPEDRPTAQELAERLAAALGGTAATPPSAASG